MILNLLCFTFLASVVVCGNNNTNIKIVKAFDCDIPAKKWDPSSPMTTKPTAIKVTRDLTKISVVYNVSTTFGPVQLATRSYQITNAAKSLVYKIEHVNCRSPLALKLISLFNLKFDKKCMLQAGVYKMADIDLTSLQWIIRRTIAINGRYSYDVEFSHAKGITSCFTAIVDIYV